MLARVAQRLAVAVRRSGFCAGTNLFLADGVLAGQEVFHVHLHVIPRNKRDGLRFWLGPRKRYDADHPAEAYAERIRAAIPAL